MDTPTEQPPHLKRIIGALLGLHAGDSLGATLEFCSWSSIQRDYPRGLRDIVGGGHFNWAAGDATDDTDLTRAVLLAYQDSARSGSARADFDVCRAAGTHMLDWFEGRWPGRTLGRRPVDVGGATATGLSQLLRTGDPERSGAGRGRAGNGSLMRCLPTGLFRRDEQAIVADSMRISAITHDDIRCTVACAAYNAAVCKLVDGGSPEAAVTAALEFAESLAEEQQCGPAVQDAIELGKRLSISDMAENSPKALPGKGSGYVLDSLAIAVAAVMDPRPLVDVLVDVVRIGSDTDTNAAIAGGLLGARDGSDAVPAEWVEVLQFAREFTEIATELAHEREKPLRP